MTGLEQRSLIRLLAEPRETLMVEYKSWLNLKEDKGRAKLAKAAIALANIGGGKIVIGMRQGKPEEQDEWISESCPAEVTPYQEDDVSAAIGKYADPVPECRLDFAEHPKTGFQHAIVTIYGDLTEPVIAKKTYGTELKEHRCYIRKLGPARSEEPNSTLEWRELFRGCVLAQRETMINAFRGIISGRVDFETPQKDDEDMHAKYLSQSTRRWRELTDMFAQDDPARLGNGYFEIAFSILGLDRNLALKELRDLMREASDASTSIWLLFEDFDSRAQPAGDSIETLYRQPNERQHGWHALSYWRVRNDGRFYLIRGYEEDADNRSAEFVYRLPIWRIGRSFDYIATVCRLLGKGLQVLSTVRYSGLRNRNLADANPYNEVSFYLRNRKCNRDEITLSTGELSPQDIEDNLEEILYELLSPLYEQFSFYELRRDFVANEVQEMRRHGR